MKPWRPYWKNLEYLMTELLRDAEPPPFSDTEKIGDWIANLPFLEISSCDGECRYLSDQLAFGPVKDFRPIHAGASYKWQMISRCECALNFCQGRVENRAEFDWNQPPAAIYRWLLIEFWSTSAFHWAYKMFGMKNRQRQIARHQFLSELSYSFRGIDPSKN